MQDGAEECDDGNDVDDDDCTNACERFVIEGCCSGSGPTTGGWLLWAIVALAVSRPRRRWRDLRR